MFVVASAVAPSALSPDCCYGPRHYDTAALRQLKTSLGENKSTWLRRTVADPDRMARVKSTGANQTRTGGKGVLSAVDLSADALSLNPSEKDIHGLE